MLKINGLYGHLQDLMIYGINRVYLVIHFIMDMVGWQTEVLRLFVEYASNRKLEVFVTINNDKNEIVVFIMNWAILGQPIILII